MGIRRMEIRGLWERPNILLNGRELLIKTFCTVLKV